MATEAKIILTAVDQTKAAITSATAGIQSLSSAIKSIPGFGGIASSLAAFAGAGALKTLIADTISWATETKRAAERIGSTVENFSGLAKVAKASGIEIETLESLMSKLALRLAGADEESKGAGHALAAIGIEAKKLRELDPAQQLQQIAVALSGYADGQGKVALIQDALGKGAQNLLPMFQDLASAQTLQGKLTTEQATAAEALQKSWNKINNEGGAWAKSIALELIPTLASLIDFLNYTKMGIYQIGSSFAVVANDIATGAKVAYTALTSGFTSEGREKIGSLLAQRENFNAAANEDARDRLANASSMREKIDKILAGDKGPAKPQLSYSSRLPTSPKSPGGGRSSAGVKAAPDDGSKLVEQLLAQVRGTMDLTEAEKLEIAIAEKKYATASKGNLDTARGYAQLLDAIKANQTAEQEAAEAAKARTDEYQRIFDATRTPLENLNAEIEHLMTLLDNGTLGEGAAAMELFGRAAQKAGERFQQLTDETEKAGDEFNHFAKSAAKNMQSAFADFLFDPFAKGTKSMLQSFGDTVRKMIAEAASAQLMKTLFGDFAGKSGGSLGGLLGGGLSKLAGLFTGGSGGAISALAGSDAPIGVLPSGFFDALPSFAVGTSYVPHDMVARIHKGERITPAEQNQTNPGNITIHVNVNGAGGHIADVRRAAGQGAREAIAALAGARRYA